MEPSTKDDTKLIQTPQEYAEAIPIMIIKALLSSEKEPEVKIYLRDLSIFQYHEMEAANDFIVSTANRVKYTVTVDEENPLFAFDETPFKTIMEKHPDHVVFRGMKKCSNIPHSFLSTSSSIVEIVGNQSGSLKWILTIDEKPEITKTVSMTYEALMEQSSNPWTKESTVEKNYEPITTQYEQYYNPAN